MCRGFIVFLFLGHISAILYLLTNATNNHLNFFSTDDFFLSLNITTKIVGLKLIFNFYHTNGLTTVRRRAFFPLDRSRIADQIDFSVINCIFEH